jgi:hypothetical protein
MLRAYARQAFRSLPEGLKGTLDYYCRSSGFLDPYGGPFNGQDGRRAVVDVLLDRGRFGLIVETGAYRGSTTAYLARFKLPLRSCESPPRQYQTARLRLRRQRHVEIVGSDSIAFLRRLADSGAFAAPVVFIYLDAHWYDHLPLVEELSLISACSRDHVIMIGNFAVPFNDGHGYDDYGLGKALTLDYLDRARAGEAFFPNLAAAVETGQRRGSVLLGAGAGFSLLRELEAEGLLVAVPFGPGRVGT